VSSCRNATYTPSILKLVSFCKKFHPPTGKRKYAVIKSGLLTI
jgi:hypothetical protein